MAAPELLTACCDVGTLDVRFEGDGEHGRDCTSGNGTKERKRRQQLDAKLQTGARKLARSSLEKAGKASRSGGLALRSRSREVVNGFKSSRLFFSGVRL